MSKIRCYYNLHKHCLSVQHKTSNGWRVAEWVNDITLKDAKFVVKESGRQRVLKEKRKNVHAYITGTPIILSDEQLEQIIWSDKVRYNPYTHSTFYTVSNNEPIYDASLCNISGKTVSIIV